MTQPTNAQVQRELERQFLFPFVWSAFETLEPGVRFLPSWHVEAMCYALEQVASGACLRLLITVPPRHGKSICASVCLPAWLLGRDPSLKIMVASYGSDLAIKHASDFRRLVSIPWFLRIFPVFQIAAHGNRLDEQITTLGGGRKAISVGGAATGFGADLIIVDDLIKAGEAASAVERQNTLNFYQQSLLSRLNDLATGRVIAIQQRLHEDDLAGHLIETGQFTHLNLPAIAVEDESIPIGLGRVRHRRQNDLLCPERQSKVDLDRRRLEIGATAFSAQYQQNPTVPGGNRMRWDWFKTYEPTAFRRPDYQYVFQAWDTAVTGEVTSDYSACVTMGLRGKAWHILDVWRGRLDFGPLRAKIITQAREWRADQVVIEHANTGISLVREIRATESNGFIYIGQPVRQDKLVRFEAQISRLTTGLYHVPTSAPWLYDFRQELVGFPTARYDDQVDALIHALEFIGRKLKNGAEERDPVTGRVLRVNRPQSRRVQNWEGED